MRIRIILLSVLAYLCCISLSAINKQGTIQSIMKISIPITVSTGERSIPSDLTTITDQGNVNNEWVTNTVDSLFFENGKLAELHRTEGTDRSKAIFYYADNHFDHAFLYSYYNGNWALIAKFMGVYDNEKISHYYGIMQIQPDVWATLVRVHFFYDNQDHVNEVYYANLDFISGQFSFERDLMTYDTTTRPITAIEALSSDSLNWTNNTQNLTTYQNGDTSTYDDWYSYFSGLIDSGNMIDYPLTEGIYIDQLLEQQWNNDNWANASKKTYTYDNNKITSTTTQEPVADNWVNLEQQQFSYENNKLISLTTLSWMEGWHNESRILYTYDVTSDEDPISVSTAPVSITSYPNPFSRQSTICIKTKKADNGILKVYDIRGRLVRDIVSFQTKSNVIESNWDGRDNEGHELANGVYFLKYNSTNQSVCSKTLLLK